MKYYISLLSALSLFSVSGHAQSWEPFPYDSVYFINEENLTDILIPVVKSNNSDELFKKMHSRWEQGFIERSVENIVLPSYQNTDVTGIHWFGDQIAYDSGILSFKSVFSNHTFEVDLYAEVGAADSQSFIIDNETYYLITNVNDQYFDADLNDSVKSISLTLTDDQFVAKEFSFIPDNPSENCTDIEMFNLGYTSANKNILVGKTTGIQKIPNLAFYPFCRSFSKYKTVSEVKAILLDYHLEVGDIIEGSSRQFYVGPPHGNTNFDYRKVITDVQLDMAGDRYIYKTEYLENVTPYSDTPTINIDFEKEFVVELYSDDLFTGIGQVQGSGFGCMLHMDSKWGYPYIHRIHQQPYPAGGIIGFQLAYIQNMAYADATLEVNSGEVSSGRTRKDCITYFNINNVQFGEEGNLTIDELNDVNTLQFAMNGNGISVNKEIEGTVTLFDVNGKLISTQFLASKTNTFQLSQRLDSGIYFIRVNELDKTYKLINL